MKPSLFSCITFAAFFCLLSWPLGVHIPSKFEIMYEARLLFSSYFYNPCRTTEGINRHFLISFHQSYTQLCTCAVCRIVLKGHTNKSNLSPADSIPTRCSIAPAKTHNNSPAPRWLTAAVWLCVWFTNQGELVSLPHCSCCSPTPFSLFLFCASAVLLNHQIGPKAVKDDQNIKNLMTFLYISPSFLCHWS